MTIAETVAEARKLLQESSFDAIFLDHDLLPEHYESKNTMMKIRGMQLHGG
ncbi:MAG: hypothetical protein HC846_08630 [Blastocatellia bacterium]|nr:hypothetical protein [Blastocatellia bacterium]